MTMDNERSYQLRVDLTSENDLSQNATYSTFKIESEAENYKLRLGGHRGTLGRCMEMMMGWLSLYTLDNSHVLGH